MASKIYCLLIVMCGILIFGLLPGCGGGGGGGGGGKTDVGGSGDGGGVTLVSIEITPASGSLAVGATRQFVATGIYSDATKQDLTEAVDWSSSAPAVATVGNTAGSFGLVSGVAAGSTTITGTLESVSGSSAVTVTTATLVSIGVTPTAPSIALGSSLQFTATGVFSDQSVQNLTASVSWNSSNTSVATIGDAAGSEGLATSAAAGSTTVTATFGGVSGSTTLTVTSATLTALQLTPTNPNMVVGQTGQFEATGIYSDNTKQDLTASVSWSSSDASVATVGNSAGNKGLAAALKTGSATITATIGGLSKSTTLTVTAPTLAAIEVTPFNTSIPLGTSRQFAAIGTFTDNSTRELTSDMTWSSTDTDVATVGNAPGSNGLATSVAPGTTTVRATLGTVQGSASLTVTSAALVAIDVTPAIPSLPAGLKQQFEATGTFSDGSVKDVTTEVAWSSSTLSVATVSNAEDSMGLALALAPGEATITATSGSVSGSALLTVTPATLVDIELSPPDPAIPLSLTQQFSATGIFSDDSVSDLTAEVTWVSSAEGIATVSNGAGSEGLATPVAPGTTTITASFGGMSASTTLTVTSATEVSIAVTPATSTLALDTTRAFTASGSYSDGSTLDITKFVTWRSSATEVAVISNAGNQKGVATGVGVGSTVITASLGSVVSNDAVLTVTSATLQSITVTPGDATMALKSSLQFSATGNFSDGTQQDLTTLATWSSSATGVAKISNAFSSQGLATGLGVGSTTITAGFHGVAGATTLTVAIASLDSIVVTPADTTLAARSTLQFTATGIFNGGAFQQDLTREVKWASTSKNAASVSNGRWTRGLATAAAAGSTTIRATKPTTAITGSTPLTVTP
jgi:uncharacterized protein YjdB